MDKKGNPVVRKAKTYTGVYIIHFEHSPPPPAGHHFFPQTRRQGRSPSRWRDELQGGAVVPPAKFFEFLTLKDAFLSRF